MSCILVEKGTPGFGVGKVEEKMGIHASETAELIFDNCRVPKENLVGKKEKDLGLPCRRWMAQESAWAPRP